MRRRGQAIRKRRIGFQASRQMRPKQKNWLPLVDLFRNYKLEIQFTLADLKRLSEIFSLPKIVYVPLSPS